MKSVIVSAPGKIEIREVETPVINAYQALVKTEMVALCNATDSKLIAGHFPGVDTYPLALGHENAGIVVAVGEKVRNFKVGDRAIGGLISDFGAQGINSGWGGFSEYVVVNDFEVLKEEGLATPEQGCWDSFEIQNSVPAHVQPEEAVISCTWREVLGAFKDFNLTPGKKVIVTMEEEVEGLEEVVITGIYSRDKNSYTGSASTYSAKELKMVGAQNVIQSLKTLDPAMMVVESKQWGSDPNRMPKIEIRGKTSVVGLQTEFENDPNQPLFILDGVETTLETIINLNMDRVASVTILKDAASTAIYGSKAANGVIVVETKSPESGQLRLSYSGNYGISFADLSDYNLMNASEKLEYELLAGRYSPMEGYDGFVDKLQEMQDYYSRLKEVLRGVDTYWLSEPLRTVFNHSHNLYIDGGDQAMRYGLGISYNNSYGVMKKTKRDGMGVNIDLIYRKKRILFSNKASMDLTNPRYPRRREER